MCYERGETKTSGLEGHADTRVEAQLTGGRDGDYCKFKDSSVYMWTPARAIIANSCFFWLLVFKTGFHCVALAVWELILQTRLACTSEICLPLPLRAGTKG